MTAFLAAAHLDVFDLIGSLRTRLGLFKQENGGALGCPVRQPRGEKFTRPPHAADGKWPELTNMLQRILRLGDQMGGIELGRVDLELLSAGACMDWLKDDGVPYEHAVMLLRTNPGVTFYAGAEVAMPGIGFLTIISRRVPRSAINMGESSAIWLAIDFRRRSQDGGGARHDLGKQ
jgi:hypothetical protein